MDDLTQKKCKPCEGEGEKLSMYQATTLLGELDDWQISNETILQKTFTFKNFFRTMSFVNAVAHIANQENHHPDMQITYNSCTINFTTHAIGGLSENDFICAAKVDLLLK